MSVAKSAKTLVSKGLRRCDECSGGGPRDPFGTPNRPCTSFGGTVWYPKSTLHLDLGDLWAPHIEMSPRFGVPKGRCFGDLRSGGGTEEAHGGRRA